ncbi:DDE-type integrase/transposase/recombinase [Microbispora sp. NPDC046933]|uniref:DDE-type integrase/transposase/recombinase n=1 Tax=Microbispora sp. NPDC046933 TaxID=3155618 RepID=UPI0033CD8047
MLWCGDVTEIDTGEGKSYLATVEDPFSRRLLGYAMSEHHDAALTVASLQMAVTTRGGDADGVVFHSDRGPGTPSGVPGPSPCPRYLSTSPSNPGWSP